MGDARQQPTKRTLRLALAMRGGVSLAVWIGGAVAEIDVLRRALPGAGDPAVREDREDRQGPEDRKGPEDPARDRAKIYADLLRAAGYGRVEVDVLAGASAGGLNAVIYGLAQSVGRTVDWVEHVWGGIGGIWALLRPTLLSRAAGDVGGLRVPSLMRGDDYFYGRLRDALLMIGTQPPAPACDHVSVDLSATLADRAQRPADPPGAVASDDRRPSVPPGRGAVHFRFQRRPAPPTSTFTDLPRPADLPVPPVAPDASTPEDEAEGTDQAEARKQVARLAYAGRTTSSFPGAFEPARIWTGAGGGSLPANEAAGQITPPNMRGVFSETGPTPFAVVDGGIFDNIPIGRALDAVAAAGAAGPTERRLIFLDPSPGPRPEPERSTPSLAAASSEDERPARRTSVAAWIPTIVRALGLKVREETSAEEIDLVRRHNHVAAQTRARLEMLATELAGRVDLPPWLAPAPARYAEYRAAHDAAHLALLLTRPSTTLLRASTPAVECAVAMDERAALRIEDELRALYRRLADPPSSDPGPTGPPLEKDVVALVETVGVLLAWCREIEALCRRLGAPVPDALPGEKAALYRILAVGRHLRDLADTELVTRVAGDLQRFPDGIADARRAQCAGSSEGLADLRTMDDEQFWGVMHETFGPDARPATGPGTLLDSLWEQTGSGCAAVRTASLGVVGANGDQGDDRWNASFFAQLYRAPLVDLPLTRLHTVLAVAGGGTAIGAEIGYDEITGDQPTPLATFLPRAEAAERRRRVTELLRDHTLDAGAEFRREPDDPRRRLIDAGSKLAGNGLANFSAFLAKDWRTHDWRWGRLDAAAGLVEVLLRGPSLDPVATAKLCEEFVCAPPAPLTPTEWQAIIGGSPAGLDQPSAWTSVGAGQVRILRNALQARLQIDVLREADRPGSADPAVGAVASGAAASGLGAILRAVDRPKVRLGDLRRRYVSGLASRVLHLAYRGMWPSTWSFPTAVARVAMVALRPALVAVPLLAAPPRALLATAAFGWLTALTRDGKVLADTADRWPVGLGAVTLLAIAGVTAARLRKAWERWTEVGDAAAAADAAPGWGEVAAWRRTARRRIVALGVAAAAMACFALFLGTGVVAATWSPSVLLLVGVALVGHLAVERVRSAPTLRGASAAERRARAVEWLVAVAAFVVVSVAALHVAALHALPTAGAAVAVHVAAVSALVGALLHDGWARWWPDGLLAVVATAGAGAAIATFTAFPPVWAALAAVGGVGACLAGVLHTRGWDPGEEIPRPSPTTAPAAA